MEEHSVEIANRIKNIIWTVCGDYSMDTKPDVEAFLRNKYCKDIARKIKYK